MRKLSQLGVICKPHTMPTLEKADGRLSDPSAIASTMRQIVNLFHPSLPSLCSLSLRLEVPSRPSSTSSFSHIGCNDSPEPLVPTTVSSGFELPSLFSDSGCGSLALFVPSSKSSGAELPFFLSRIDCKDSAEPLGKSSRDMLVF